MWSTVLQGDLRVSFDSYFQEVYGPRWSTLLEALKKPERQIAITLSKDQEHPYYLSEASAIAARALDVQSGDQVLDMCAAPGGKTLLLLERLMSTPQNSETPPGLLVSNEYSSARRARLKRVIQEFVPEVHREKIELRGKDGIRFGILEPERYDRILIDAPCSGERHLLEHPVELEKWTPARSKNLSKKQYGLLTSGILALKQHGRLLYSTCSISPQENDGVILRALKRKSDLIELDLPPLDPELSELKIERTETGYIFLPDRSSTGPLFFSRLRKRARLD